MNCPFCGAEARLAQFDHFCCIECTSVRCLCRTELNVGEERVWEAWNKRTKPLAEASMGLCPCCGGKPLHRVTQGAAQWHYVECGGCGLRHLATKTRADALTKWQVRHG